MKRLFIILLSVFFLFTVRADEGMWLLTMLDKKHADMRAGGLRLMADDIYNINKSSLKDAIVQFGNGCTGEIISSQGLLLTNHHCGYRQIQSHSTVENNYLRDGFWAKTFAEEISNPGLTARFLVRIEDVTNKVLAGVNDIMTEDERASLISENSKKIESEAEEGNHYNAQVRSFYFGNEYYLMVYEVFKDVRLVGTPPSSIGKFGGDTDNWMWPRHTGDFALFRVYMSPDGKPVDYSPENVPYKPKHHLPISLKGVMENDYAMILGYSGRTNRYMSSFDVIEAIEYINPTIVSIRDEKLAILRERMNSSEDIRIKYAAKYAGTSNYWKYFIGQTRGLKRLKVAEEKQKIEQKFNNWAKSKPELNEKYGMVITNLERYQKELSKYKLYRTYASEAALRGTDLLGFAASFNQLYTMLENQTNPDEIKNRASRLVSHANNFYKDFDKETEEMLFTTLLQVFYDSVEPAFYPTIFDEIRKKYRGDMGRYTKMAFANSIFVSEQSVLSFLENPNYRTLDNDPIFKLMHSIRGSLSKFDLMYKEQQDQLNKAYRLFMDGLRIMEKDKIFYPDANSTMRITYGSVKSYSPADAVVFDYYTTLDGVMEKEDPDNLEFIVHPKLKELWQKKDYGNYAFNGQIRTCFLSNNDITGGNSGSPVLNGRGELIGLAFDGNWEAMSGDIAFEPALQRTISVDIRYVLFIIDKFAGAKHLVDEMTIIR